MELYPAGASLGKLDAPKLNKRIRSFLPTTLIFVAATLKNMLLGAALFAASLILQSPSTPNQIALLQVFGISLFCAIACDAFIFRSALKNLALVRLWLQALLFKRVFSLDLSHYARIMLSEEILVARKAIACTISRYFSETPPAMNAWAFITLNILALLLLKPTPALFKGFSVTQNAQ